MKDWYRLIKVYREEDYDPYADPFLTADEVIEQERNATYILHDIYDGLGKPYKGFSRKHCVAMLFHFPKSKQPKMDEGKYQIVGSNGEFWTQAEPFRSILSQADALDLLSWQNDERRRAAQKYKQRVYRERKKANNL